MAETPILGAYITNNSIELIEVQPDDSVRNFSIPVELEPPLQDIALPENSIQSDIITTKIKEKLTSEGITTSQVCLSLPTKDIIFRSFMMPWMQPNEIDNAVKFEASKYIPFNLDELNYTIHPITITDNDIKKITIIFIAIKKATLKYYTNLFLNADLNIEIIEPSSLSLIRLLSSKNIVDPSIITAIINQSENEGKIIIIEGGIPQFVREFQLTSAPSGQEGSVPEISNFDRLVNETTISLEYYNRLNPEIEVKELIYVNSENLEESSLKLEEHTGITVKQVAFNSLITSIDSVSSEILQAYGSTLYQTAPLKANFFLTDTAGVTTVEQPVNFTFESEPFDIKAIIPVAAVCLAIILAIFFFTSSGPSKMKTKIAQIKQDLGIFEGLSTTSIESKSSSMRNRLKEFKTIRLESEIAYYLEVVPSKLTEGMWLEKIKVNFKQPPKPDKTSSKRSKSKEEDEPSIIVTITGYAYVEAIRQQFRLVNDFLKNLQADNKFSESFKTIELDTTKAKDIDGFSTTFFKIVCK